MADLAGDVNLVCNFTSEDSSLPLNTDRRVQQCKLIVYPTSRWPWLFQVSQQNPAAPSHTSPPAGTLSPLGRSWWTSIKCSIPRSLFLLWCHC